MKSINENFISPISSYIENKKKPSISRNLTFSLLLSVIIVSAVAIAINLYNSVKKAQDSLEIRANEYITILAESLEIPLWDLETEAVKRIGHIYSKDRYITDLKVIDNNNSILFQIEKNDEEQRIQRVTNVLHSGKLVGRIHLGLTTLHTRQAYKQMLIISITTIFVILCTLTLLTGFFFKIFLRKPFNHFSEIFKAYSNGNYETYDLMAPAMEFQPLVDFLKEMGKKIKKQMNDLHQAEQKYRSIFENAVEGIFQCTLNAKFISANTATARILGYDSSDDLVNSIYSISEQCYTTTKDSNYFMKCLSDELISFEIEALMFRKDKTKIWAILSARKVFDNYGNVKYYEGSLVDITNRKIAEEQIRKHKEELEDLVKNRTTELINANKKLSISIKEQEQRNLEMTRINQMSDLLHACKNEFETYGILESACKQLFSNDSGYLCIIDETRTRMEIMACWGDFHLSKTTLLSFDDCWALRRGKEHFVESKEIGPFCTHLSSKIVNGYLCTPIVAQGEALGVLHICFGNYSENDFKRIFKEKKIIINRIVEHYALSLVNLRLRESLRMESIQDPLTGLYNRRYMEKSIEREASRCEKYNKNLGVVMIDIDHFKKFNDTYGHETGDAVLENLSAFIKKNVRDEDIACRYGGEEFMLIMPELSLEETKKMAEKLRAGIKKDVKIRYKNKILDITASLGVSAYIEHGPGINNVIQAADAALYIAKDNGRDQVAVA